MPRQETVRMERPVRVARMPRVARIPRVARRLLAITLERARANAVSLSRNSVGSLEPERFITFPMFFEASGASSSTHRNSEGSESVVLLGASGQVQVRFVWGAP